MWVGYSESRDFFFSFFLFVFVCFMFVLLVDLADPVLHALPSFHNTSFLHSHFYLRYIAT